MRKSKRTGLMFRKQLTNRVFGFKQWTTCKSVCLFVGGMGFSTKTGQVERESNVFGSDRLRESVFGAQELRHMVVEV